MIFRIRMQMREQIRVEVQGGDPEEQLQWSKMLLSFAQQAIAIQSRNPEGQLQQSKMLAFRGSEGGYNGLKYPI